MKILIVEDNHKYSEGLAGLFKRNRFKVQIVRTYKEIWKLAKQQRGVGFCETFSVALLDYDLNIGGGLNGKEVAELFKIPKDRIIAISTGDFDQSYGMYIWRGKEILFEDQEGNKDRIEMMKRSMSRQLIKLVRTCLEMSTSS